LRLLSEAVAVRRLRPLAPLTPWSKNVAALELAANDYITLRRQFRGFENRTLVMSRAIVVTVCMISSSESLALDSKILPPRGAGWLPRRAHRTQLPSDFPMRSHRSCGCRTFARGWLSYCSNRWKTPQTRLRATRQGLGALGPRGHRSGDHGDGPAATEPETSARLLSRGEGNAAQRRRAIGR
jgi:hypothetical protein